MDAAASPGGKGVSVVLTTTRSARQGLDVLAIIAASNASANSFGFNLKTVEHFVAYDVGGVYEDIPVFFTPHPKFVSGACINNAGVALKVGGSLGDVLSTTSRVLVGWAQIAAAVTHDVGAEKRVYEYVCTDPLSRATGREWALRFTSKTTPETEARLKKELREQSQKGGACAAPHAPASPPTTL